MSIIISTAVELPSLPPPPLRIRPMTRYEYSVAILRRTQQLQEPNVLPRVPIIADTTGRIDPTNIAISEMRSGKLNISINRDTNVYNFDGRNILRSAPASTGDDGDGDDHTNCLCHPHPEPNDEQDIDDL